MQDIKKTPKRKQEAAVDTGSPKKQKTATPVSKPKQKPQKQSPQKNGNQQQSPKEQKVKAKLQKANGKAPAEKKIKVEKSSSEDVKKARKQRFRQKKILIKEEIKNLREGTLKVSDVQHVNFKFIEKAVASMNAKPTLTKTAKTKLKMFEKLLELKKTGDISVFKKTPPPKKGDVKKEKKPVNPKKEKKEKKQQPIVKVVKKESSDDDDDDDEEDDDSDVKMDADDDDEETVCDDGQEDDDDEEEDDDDDDDDDDESSDEEGSADKEGSDDDDSDEEESDEAPPAKQPKQIKKEKPTQEKSPKKELKPFAGTGNEQTTPSKFQQNDDNVVFVGNLNVNITEEALRSHFAKAGEVASVSIPASKDKPTKIAFVEFADNDSCEKALSLHQTSLNGQNISVRKYVKRTPNNRDGGSPRRGGGGFRGSRGGNFNRGGRGGNFNRGGRGGPRGGGGFRGGFNKNRN